MTKRPPKTYPPGYFSAPVRAWKSMRFESRLAIDPKTKRYASDYALAQHAIRGRKAA